LFHRLIRLLCAWLCRCEDRPAAHVLAIPDAAPPARPRHRGAIRPSVVLYLPDMVAPVDPSPEAVAQAFNAVPGWSKLVEGYGGTRQLAPRAAFGNPAELDKLIAQAAQNAERAGVIGYRPLDHRRCFLLPIPESTRRPPVDAYCQLRADLQRIGGRVYLSLPSRNAQPSDAYAGPASAATGVGIGIGARNLQSRASGRAIDGAGQWLVDVEKAWITISSQMQDLPTVLAVVQSGDLVDLHHGTAVAGMLLGTAGATSFAGLAPGVRFHRAPFLEVAGQPQPETNLAATILDAGIRLGQSPSGRGVLMLQQETWDSLPLETSPLEFAAIQTVAAAGHIVVQPAGNASQDLDTVSGFWFDASNNLVERPLNPAQAIATSGAITVAAGRSGLPLGTGGFGQLHPQSNHGAVVDAWAWGDSIATLGATLDATGSPVAVADPAGFGGTSGATAIVAGAVVLLQQLRAEADQPPLQPGELRALLRDPALGTAGAAQGPLQGVAMPDLVKLQQRLNL
jgi:hypothetical protein